MSYDRSLSEPMPEGEEQPPPGVATMAVVRWILVGLMALFAAAAVLHYAGVFKASGRSDGAKVLHYCPMHPSVVREQPGDCPICDMSLVPKDDAHPKAETSRSDVPGLIAVDLTP